MRLDRSEVAPPTDGHRDTWAHSFVAECVDDRVYRRSAPGVGDAKALHHARIQTVACGFGTQTSHGTDEQTTAEVVERPVTAYATAPRLDPATE